MLEDSVEHRSCEFGEFGDKLAEFSVEVAKE